MRKRPPPQQGTPPPPPRWLKQKQRCDESIAYPLAYLVAPFPPMPSCYSFLGRTCSVLRRQWNCESETNRVWLWK